MSPIPKALDKIGSMNIRTKMMLYSCFAIVLVPLGLLVAKETLPPDQVNNLLAIWIAAGLILLFPLSSSLLHLLVLRKIASLNSLCLKMKGGDYSPFQSLPRAPIEGDEIQNLEYNLLWMGHVINSRQKALMQAMGDLELAQRQAAESLDYASLIQAAFLPPPERFLKVFSDHFLLWSQRDTVGGDSYWLKETPGGYFFAVVDCTGHGVPGAFMSLIVHSLFERQDVAAMEGDPAALLGKMNRGIHSALTKSEGRSGADDGMDCIICYLNRQRTKLVFTGARNALYVTHTDGTIAEYKGDRCGAGYLRSPQDFTFTNQIIDVEPKMRCYAFTDGITDQVGGEKNLPYGKRRLRRFILSQLGTGFTEQKGELLLQLGKYMGTEKRRDDITILGFEL